MGFFNFIEHTTATIHFTDNSSHTYYKLPPNITEQEIIDRVRKDVPEKIIAYYPRDNKRLWVDITRQQVSKNDIPDTSRRRPVPMTDIRRENIAKETRQREKNVNIRQSSNIIGPIITLIESNPKAVIPPVRGRNPIQRQEVQPVTKVKKQESTPAKKNSVIGKIYKSPEQAQSAVRQYENATNKKATFVERRITNRFTRLPEIVYETVDISKNKKPTPRNSIGNIITSGNEFTPRNNSIVRRLNTR